MKKNVEIIKPNKDYYKFRWEILRKPLNQEVGSEKDELEEESYHFALKNKNKFIAIGRLHKKSKIQGQIRFMAVIPDYQNQGIGALVLKAIEKKSKVIGLQEIILNARESVVPFYQKNGYKIEKKSHMLFGKIQHYLMKKSIINFDI